MFSATTQIDKRKASDLIVFPFWQTAKGPKAASVITGYQKVIKEALKTGDFKGKNGEILLLYSQSSHEPRAILLGLGYEKEITQEGVRIAYSAITKKCQALKIASISLVFPTVSELRYLKQDPFLQALGEGLLLSNYVWEELKTGEKAVLLKKIAIIGILPKKLSLLRECQEIAEGVYLARDLINGNAQTITPGYLANTARSIAQKFKNVSATVFDRKRIEKEKMGLFAAVAQGATNEPAFITLSYKGTVASQKPIVLIGKGVTYDTGGLNLKPTGSIESMRDDMSGAATVLATLSVVAQLKLKINVTAVVAATENVIDANSFRPGDVFNAYNGTTVEIGNTDAEGRLTLADAISYSVKKLKPACIVDLATLTGAMVVALGSEVSGFFSNDETLSSDLLDSSSSTGESLWRLPLYESYNKLLKSDVADVNNIGGRAGGAITAALFLQKFVEGTPWAHIDIAGTAFASSAKGYLPKNGIGFGVRLLVDFLQKK